MKDLPLNKLEYLEYLYTDFLKLQDDIPKILESLSKSNEESSPLINEEFYSSVAIRLRKYYRGLNLNAPNIEVLIHSPFNFLEIINILTDQFAKQYIVESEKNKLNRFQMILDIAKLEAINQNNIDIINKLNQLNAASILNDNGSRFKKIIKPLKSEIGVVLSTLIENIAKGATLALLKK